MIILSKMLIAATIGAGAMLAGAANNTTTAPNGNQAGSSVFDETTRYFEFQGADGQEDQPAQWKEITESEYDDITCPGTRRGCALVTTTVIGDATNGYHPSEIPVITDPNNADNMSPIAELPVLEVKNRANSY